MSDKNRPMPMDNVELSVRVETRVSTLLSLRNTLRIEHPFVREALNLVDEAHRNQRLGGERRGVLIHGESRAGKTTALDMWSRRHPVEEVNGIPKTKFLSLSFPKSVTMAQVTEDLLRKLGDPFPFKGSVSTRRARFIEMLRKRGVEVLIFDESQNILTDRSTSTVNNICAWIRDLMDPKIYNLAVVLAGLDSTRQIIDYDESVENRFFRPVNLQAFGAAAEHDLRSLRAILRALERHYEVASSVDLSSSISAARFFLSSRGLIGLIVDLVERAGEYAIRDGRDRLTLGDLARAHDLFITKAIEGVGNPFTADVARVIKCLESGRLERVPKGEMKKRIRAKKRETKVGDVLTLSP